MHSKKQLCLLLHWLAVVVLAPLLASNLWSQVAAGTILGTVTDTSGARVPRANITIKNVATGSVRVVTTNSDGLYRAPDLSPSTYEIAAGATGFATVVRSEERRVGKSVGRGDRGIVENKRYRVCYEMRCRS